MIQYHLIHTDKEVDDKADVLPLGCHRTGLSHCPESGETDCKKKNSFFLDFSSAYVAKQGQACRGR